MDPPQHASCVFELSWGGNIQRWCEKATASTVSKRAESTLWRLLVTWFATSHSAGEPPRIGALLTAQLKLAERRAHLYHTLTSPAETRKRRSLSLSNTGAPAPMRPMGGATSGRVALSRLYPVAGLCCRRTHAVTGAHSDQLRRGGSVSVRAPSGGGGAGATLPLPVSPQPVTKDTGGSAAR